jgi:hypothetical protein
MRFLNGPLQIVKNHTIPLMPTNPRKIASQKEPDATEPIKCFAQRFIKETLHHEKGVPWAKIPFLAKSCQIILATYRPPVLSD